MTGSNAVMVALAVALWLAGGLGTWWVLRRARRRASVHADLPATATLPAAPVLEVAPPQPSSPRPAAPLRATLHYTDAKGEGSVPGPIRSHPEELAAVLGSRHPSSLSKPLMS